MRNSDKRRAVYNYYRSQGYSAKEARAMRGRWREVWKDHFKHVKHARMKAYQEGRSYRSIKPPQISFTQSDKARIRRELISKGISPKVAGQWLRLKPVNLQRKLINTEAYFKQLKAIAGNTRRRVSSIMKKATKALAKARTTRQVYEILADAYDLVVGISG